MACPLPPSQINNLKLFIDLCTKDPDILYYNELDFFKNYLESLGGTIPPKKRLSEPKNSEAKVSEVSEEDVEENESEESEVELDFEGVIEPDNDLPQVMGSSDKEVTEDDIEKANEKKRVAIDLFAQGKYKDAIDMYTEAILLNPCAAVLYAKRGQCFLQLQKPNACIRDCTQALEINPDNAAAYKFRGRAHRLLGNFLKAAEDLRMACKIDFDEQTDEWLKEVTSNARKIEEHRRKYDRKQLEKELKQTRRRIEKMKEEQQKRSEAEAEGDGDSYMAKLEALLKLSEDPELRTAFQDPEVVQAFRDVSRDPLNFFKYQANPKFSSIINKLKSKFMDGAPEGWSQMAAGLGGFTGSSAPGQFTFGSGPQPKGTASAAAATDVDLD